MMTFKKLCRHLKYRYPFVEENVDLEIRMEAIRERNAKGQSPSTLPELPDDFEPPLL